MIVLFVLIVHCITVRLIKVPFGCLGDFLSGKYFSFSLAQCARPKPVIHKLKQNKNNNRKEKQNK